MSETLHQLLEIVTAYESALETTAPPAPTRGSGGAANPSDGGASTDLSREGDLSPVLSAVLDPLVEACRRSAEALTPDAPTRVDEYANLDPTAHK